MFHHAAPFRQPDKYGPNEGKWGTRRYVLSEIRLNSRNLRCLKRILGETGFMNGTKKKNTKQTGFSSALKSLPLVVVVVGCPAGKDKNSPLVKHVNSSTLMCSPAGNVPLPVSVVHCTDCCEIARTGEKICRMTLAFWMSFHCVPTTRSDDAKWMHLWHERARK